MVVDVKALENKNIQKATSVQSLNQTKQVKNFFAEVKAEFNRITWTSKEELQTYTKIVVISSFVLGMGVYFVDVAIRLCLETLEAATLLIFG